MSNRKETLDRKKIAVFSIWLVVTVSGTVWYLKQDDNEKRSFSKPKKSKTEIDLIHNATANANSIPAIIQKNELRSERIPKIRTHKEIKCPVAGQSLAKETYAISPSVGRTITTKHNTIVSIPQNAFLNKKGEVIKDKVDVSIKEMHNFVDIFLSGVPMQYDSAGKGMLESAGMIEITASHNGEEVLVNPQSKINVMLTALNQSSENNIYYFDPAKQEWVYQQKSTFISPPNRNVSITTSIDSETVFKPYRPNKYKVGIYAKLIGERSSIPLVRKKKEANSVLFTIRNIDHSYPENRLINRVVWKYTGDSAAYIYSELTRKFPFKIAGYRDYSYWAFVDISYDSSSNLYSFRFNNEDHEELSLNAYPQNMSDAEKNRTVGKITKKMPSIREKRIAKAEARFAAYSADTADAGSTKYRTRYKTIRYFLVDDTGNRNATTTKKHFLHKITICTDETGRVDTIHSRNSCDWVYYSEKVGNESIVRSYFTVSQFGFWNCDRPTGLPKGAAVYASFVDSTGKKIIPGSIYLVEKNKNTVFTYYDVEKNKLKFNPKTENILWTMADDSTIAYILPEDFKNIYLLNRETNKINFPLRLAPTPKTQAAWSALLKVYS